MRTKQQKGMVIKMLECFYPDEYVDSTYGIAFEEEYKKGYRAVVFDIDNTLVPHGAPAEERSIQLFRKLKEMGYRTMVLSNNKEPRVKSFAGQVDTDYIFKANKPFPEGYRRAMKQLNTTPDNTLFVGDQLFTDVWGAKKAGMRTYLVKPINPKEEIQIVLKRFLEKPVLFFYNRKMKKEGRRGK